MSIFFKSEEHKARFLACMQSIGKIYDGKLDPEYASALYLLSAHAGIWNKAQAYVGRDGLDIPTMLLERDFSSGQAVLIQLAGNLFNGVTHLDALEMVWLDHTNFHLALTALQLRRSSLHIDSFK
jgi:hypothetical protein